MLIKTGWWDSSLALWDFSRSNRHCIQLSTTNTIYISRFVIAVSAFRSSRPELFCEKSVFKNFAKFTGASWHRRFLWILQNFKGDPFSQNTYNGCFSHLHYSRSPILILYVITVEAWMVSFLLWWNERLHFHMYFPQNNRYLHWNII